MRRAFYQRGRDPAPRFGERWTADEIAFASGRLLTWTPQQIAAKLGRTVAGLRRMLWSRRLSVTAASGFVTSGAAAKLTGFSQQHLTALARRGIVTATRIPGGRNWFFAPDALPLRTAKRRGRWRDAA